jgi:hypothetical protein
MMDDASDRRIALNSAKLPELLPRQENRRHVGYSGAQPIP